MNSDIKESVNLTQSRQILSPAEFFNSCATDCSNLGITSFDCYGDFASNPTDSWLKQFEIEIATELGKECAIFLPSGIMAQNIAIKICQNFQNSNRFICHHTSHLLIHEQSGYDKLLGCKPYIIPSEISSERIINNPLSYNEVVDYLYLVGEEKPALLIIEVPHRGIKYRIHVI
jgi:hypothetical protein